MQEELVRQAQRGDAEAFDSLARTAGDRCLAKAVRILRDIAGALVTLWISAPLHRNSPLWVVAASYWPTTGSELRAEMNAIVDSMTILHTD